LGPPGSSGRTRGVRRAPRTSLATPGGEQMVNGSGFDTLRVYRRGVVGCLLFNRPAARNAMNVEMHDELWRGWSTLEGDPEVKVIVCSGAGRHFSSGVDLVDLADANRSEVFRGDVERPESARFTGRDCGITKPVVAAV